MALAGLVIAAPSPGASPADYYTAAEAAQDDDLRATLQATIEKGHKRLSCKKVWAALEYTDEDPKNPNNVILFYTGRSQPKSHRDRGGRDGNA